MAIVVCRSFPIVNTFVILNVPLLKYLPVILNIWMSQFATEYSEIILLVLTGKSKEQFVDNKIHSLFFFHV